MTNGCCKVNCCKKAVCGGNGRIANLNFKANFNGDAVESLAFQYCNNDSVEGLSWPEVEECEVSFLNKKFKKEIRKDIPIDRKV